MLLFVLFLVNVLRLHGQLKLRHTVEKLALLPAACILL